MQNVIIAGVLEIGEYDFLGVGFSVGAGLAEFFGSPQAQQLVAAGYCLELKLLVMRELLFEAFFALVECGHAALVVTARDQFLVDHLRT